MFLKIATNFVHLLHLCEFSLSSVKSNAYEKLLSY